MLGLLESFHRGQTLRLPLLRFALCTHLAVLGKHNPPHFSPRGFLTPRRPCIPLLRLPRGAAGEH